MTSHRRGVFNGFHWKWGFWCIPNSVFCVVQPCRVLFFLQRKIHPWCFYSLKQCFLHSTKTILNGTRIEVKHFRMHIRRGCSVAPPFVSDAPPIFSVAPPWDSHKNNSDNSGDMLSLRPKNATERRLATRMLCLRNTADSRVVENTSAELPT